MILERTNLLKWSLLVLPICFAAAVADEPSAPARLPRDNLLVYRDAQFQLRDVRTVTDWSQRRMEILDKTISVMGRMPGGKERGPVEFQVVEEVDGGSFVRRLITYTAQSNDKVPAYFLIPKTALANGNQKAPAVLCLHPTDNKVGHGTVVGLGPSSSPAYAVELAQRGFVVLAPSYPLLASYQPDLRVLGWDSGTMKAIWNNIRGMDLLDSLPYVKHHRYAAIGHSLGGHNAIFTAVFDERIDAVVSCCGFDSFLDYYGGEDKNWHHGKGWTQTRYMPKLAKYRGRLADTPFDFHELIGALAPRHVLIIAPKNDDNFRADSVDRVVAAARPVFELYGHSQRLRVEHPDGGHGFAEPMRNKAYEMIESVLRR